jgi:serine/threonine protein phosphatase PrpC
MLRVSAFTEAGGHPVNEDAVVARPHPLDPNAWVVCLADGQGGRAGGARAARVAVDTLADRAAQHPPPDLTDRNLFRELLTAADAAVAADPGAGFTTLVGLVAWDGGVSGGSCGDSAALLVDSDGPAVLTAHQFKNPPVGSGEALFVPFAVEIARPWRLVVMSDGVWKYAGWDRVTDAAGRLGGDDLLAELQAAARLRGSGRFPDNFTAVVVEPIL